MADDVIYQFVDVTTGETVGVNGAPLADYAYSDRFGTVEAAFPQQLIVSPADVTEIDELVDGVVVGGVFTGYGSGGEETQGSQAGIAVQYFNVSGLPVFGRFDPYNPCFANGTLIATTVGPVSVQSLRPGDIVTTLAGPAVVTWIGHRRARDADVIRVRTGTLGATRDLILSDDHALFVDGCLVPAGLLVDSEGIVRERRDEVTFWHVELERHAVLLAEGVQAESYLDTGNRQQFGNCPITYDPVQATGDTCAEMVLAGARLEEVRAALRVLAAA